MVSVVFGWVGSGGVGSTVLRKGVMCCGEPPQRRPFLTRPDQRGVLGRMRGARLVDSAIADVWRDECRSHILSLKKKRVGVLLPIGLVLSFL